MDQSDIINRSSGSEARARPTSGRNAAIDGWRGVSVSLVILGHIFAYRVPIGQFHILPGRVVSAISALGELGVSIFFAISGYLITALLIAEEDRAGSISLKAFYVRRIFRIMPAFYFYMLTIFLLAAAGWVQIPGNSFLLSATYACNFAGFRCSWWLAHTWSLAVEEQFYILWPVIFAVIPFLRFRAAIILLCLFLVFSALDPNLVSFAYILTGVVVALSKRLQLLASRADYRLALVALALLAIFPAIFPSNAALPFKPILVGIALFGSLLSPKCATLRGLLSQRWLGRIGLVSYSLYLWQQLALAPEIWGEMPTGSQSLYDFAGPMMAFAFIPLALASYRFLEVPMIRIGHRLSKAITAAETGGRAIKI